METFYSKFTQIDIKQQQRLPLPEVCWLFMCNVEMQTKLSFRKKMQVFSVTNNGGQKWLFRAIKMGRRKNMI
jgi:hypothetical protein